MSDKVNKGEPTMVDLDLQFHLLNSRLGPAVVLTDLLIMGEVGESETREILASIQRSLSESEKIIEDIRHQIAKDQNQQERCDRGPSFK